MNYVNVDGVRYKVIENLGFQGGYNAKIVRDSSSPTGERVIVKEHGKWRFWTIQDRIGG